MKPKEIFKTWKKVFSFRYLLLAIILAIAFYSLNIIISNFGSLSSFYLSKGFFATLKFFFIMALGFYNVVPISSYIVFIIVSILFGFLISLIFYKVNANISLSKSTRFFGVFGVFLGALFPGCAACGIGLLAVLGIGTAFLTFLPFKGLELSVLAVIILGFSIVKMTNDINDCKACEIKFNTSENN